tara:strand:+ start:176 stop:424 length:249 start_codon:yes stop_codon:yes gene_type:complete
MTKSERTEATTGPVAASITFPELMEAMHGPQWRFHLVFAWGTLANHLLTELPTDDLPDYIPASLDTLWSVAVFIENDIKAKP